MYYDYRAFLNTIIQSLSDLDVSVRYLADCLFLCVTLICGIIIIRSKFR